jgi:hypothetical protein
VGIGLALLLSRCASNSPAASSTTREPLLSAVHCWAWEVHRPEELIVSVFSGVTSFEGTDAIPGVHVAVRNRTTGKVSETMSGEDGRFSIPGLPAGFYDAVACKEGFNPWLAVVEISPSAAGRSITAILGLAA